MDIKRLDENVITKIQSGCNVNNLTQCVSELVLNSLDANSSAIAVRLNLTSFRIQVVDNGCGISEDNIAKVGCKYMTNKLREHQEITKTLKTHGFRGENLWSISKVSKFLNIISRRSDCDKTYSKTFSHGKSGEVVEVKKRHSSGTTITINGFLDKIPVRQKKLNRHFELEEISKFFEGVSIIYPQVSLSLRDDSSGDLLFKHHKCDNVIQSFLGLVLDIKEEDLTIFKVKKENTTLEALLLKELFPEKKIQYIFFNKRPASCPKLQNFVSKELTKGFKGRGNFKKGHPMFMLNIKCSLSSYLLRYENSRAVVEMKNFDLISGCIQKLMTNFFGKPETTMENNVKQNELKSVCGVSDLSGAIKKYGFKSWKHNDISHFEYTLNIENCHTIDHKNVLPANLNFPLCKMGKPNPLPIEIHERKGKEIINFEPKSNVVEKKEEVKPLLPSKKQQKIEKNSRDNVFKKLSVLEKECQDLLSKNVHEETLFSSLNIDENKGKSLIMYMFLKSTEMFPHNDDSESLYLNESKDTVMESNIFYKNVTETRKHKFDKTISVSVKIKRNKHSDELRTNILRNVTFTKSRKEKRKLENVNLEESIMKKKKGDLMVFSSFKNCKENPLVDIKNCLGKLKSDKMIQTSPINQHTNEFGRENQHFAPSFGLHNQFNLCLRFAPNKKGYCENISFDNNSLSLMKLNENVDISNWGFPLDFRNHQCLKRKRSLDLKNISFLPKEKKYRRNPKSNFKFKISPYHDNSVDLRDISLNHIPKVEPGIRIENASEGKKENQDRNILPLHNMCLECPHKQIRQRDEYKTKNRIFDNRDSFGLYPNKKLQRFNSEPVRTISNSVLKTKERIDRLFFKRRASEVINGSRNEPFSVDSLEVTSPPGDRFLWKEYLKKRKLNDGKISNEVVHQEKLRRHLPENFVEKDSSAEEVTMEKNEVVASPDLFSDKEISVRQSFKSKFQEKRSMNKKEYAKNESNCIKTTIGKKLTLDSGRDDGNIRAETNDMDEFLDKNTVIPSELLGKNGNFEFKLRPQFMPKGLSPVLVEKERVREKLSTQTKEQLQHEILRNQELDVIKWRGDVDVTRFDVEKTSLGKLFPKISQKFSKSLFDHLKIIGQLDKKFIVTIDSSSGHLILFDQHAVHERIRLEKLTEENKNNNTSCENVTIFLTQSDVKILKNHEKYLNQIGIYSRFMKNGIIIQKIPLSLQRRLRTESRDSDWSLPKILNILIQEIINNIKDTRGVLNGLPKLIQQILCMEACRGSVKFGDYLSKKEIQTFMKELSRCTLPFQCAHGRPTLVPIEILDKIEEKISRPKLGRLLHRKY